MRGYRLYLITSDNRIERPIDMVCDDDAEALKLADEHREGRPAELWERARIVAKLPKRLEA